MKSQVSIIVATTIDRAIGRQGDMLYHIGDDLRRFKQITMGHPLVMGRKTFDSLPGGALAGRRNIVVTRSAQWSAPRTERAASLARAIEMAAADGEIMVIGGGEIYRQAMEVADRIYLTEIEATAADADTYFPEIDPALWHETERSEALTDPRTGVKYRFITLERAEPTVG